MSATASSTPMRRGIIVRCLEVHVRALFARLVERKLARLRAMGWCSLSASPPVLSKARIPSTVAIVSRLPRDGVNGPRRWKRRDPIGGYAAFYASPGSRLRQVKLRLHFGDHRPAPVLRLKLHGTKSTTPAADLEPGLGLLSGTGTGTRATPATAKPKCRNTIVSNSQTKGGMKGHNNASPFSAVPWSPVIACLYV